MRINYKEKKKNIRPTKPNFEKISRYLCFIFYSLKSAAFAASPVSRQPQCGVGRFEKFEHIRIRYLKLLKSCLTSQPATCVSEKPVTPGRLTLYYAKLATPQDFHQICNYLKLRF